MRYSLSPVRWLPISALQPLSPHPSRLWCILDLQRRTPLRPLKGGRCRVKRGSGGLGTHFIARKPLSRALRARQLKVNGSEASREATLRCPFQGSRAWCTTHIDAPLKRETSK